MNELEYLNKGAFLMGIELTSEQSEKLLAYMHLTLEFNESINLTANKEAESFIEMNILDSLGSSSFITDNKSLIDVGSGCGLPGIVLKIIKPELELTLLDSLNKRIEVMKSLCEALELNDVCFVCDRAEDAARNERLRESFDLAIARAVAPMNILCELCAGFVKPGGIVIAMKGKNLALETAAMNEKERKLGLTLSNITTYELPYSKIERKLALLNKTESLDKAYPRRIKKIKTCPLW